MHGRVVEVVERQFFATTTVNWKHQSSRNITKVKQLSPALEVLKFMLYEATNTLLAQYRLEHPLHIH